MKGREGKEITRLGMRRGEIWESKPRLSECQTATRIRFRFGDEELAKKIGTVTTWNTLLEQACCSIFASTVRRMRRPGLLGRSGLGSGRERGKWRGRDASRMEKERKEKHQTSRNRHGLRSKSGGGQTGREPSKIGEDGSQDISLRAHGTWTLGKACRQTPDMGGRMRSSVTSMWISQKPRWLLVRGGHSSPSQSAEEKLRKVRVGLELESPGSDAVRQLRAGEPRFMGPYPPARCERISVIRGCVQASAALGFSSGRYLCTHLMVYFRSILVLNNHAHS